MLGCASCSLCQRRLGNARPIARLQTLSGFTCIAPPQAARVVTPDRPDPLHVPFAVAPSGRQPQARIPRMPSAKPLSLQRSCYSPRPCQLPEATAFCLSLSILHPYPPTCPWSPAQCCVLPSCLCFALSSAYPHSHTVIIRCFAASYPNSILSPYHPLVRDPSSGAPCTRHDINLPIRRPSSPGRPRRLAHGTADTSSTTYL